MAALTIQVCKLTPDASEFGPVIGAFEESADPVDSAAEDADTPEQRQKDRFQALAVIADHSGSTEFKKIVDDIINERISLFEASSLPAFGSTMMSLAAKAPATEEDHDEESELYFPEPEDWDEPDDWWGKWKASQG